jgi:chemotaxis protein MotB
MAKEQPVIIKKIIKKGHVHHGGAWKLAYADFVTAMMAFFLLMWLLGSTDEKTRIGISEYFQDPYKATLVDKGLIPTLEVIKPTEIDRQAEKQAEKNDLLQLEKLKKKIQDMVEVNPELSKVKEQIKLEITPEGLRVQIVDNKNMPMFKSASSETEPQIRLILRALAPVINKLPNKITINGHTDAKPFPVNRKGYSNWELSSDRANAARYELNQGGLAEEKILKVTGLSASIPYNPTDAEDPMNRRISIIVMNKKTEQHVFQEAGTKPATTVVPPLTKTPSDKPLNTGIKPQPDKPLNTEIKPQPDKH